MTDSIYESGINFIANNTFYIEKSELYKNIGNDVRTVEFIRIKDNKLMFVEAKTTFPNPNNPENDNPNIYRAEICAITDKFIHSLHLLSSLCVGVTKDTLFEKNIFPDNVSLVFILVIKNHMLDWCKPIEYLLKASLPLYLTNIWKPNVIVINHDAAIKYGLAHA